MKGQVLPRMVLVLFSQWDERILGRTERGVAMQRACFLRLLPAYGATVLEA